MGTCRDPNEEEDRYYDRVIGAEIVAVHQDHESVWLHLSNGDLIAFIADPLGGFDAEIHPEEDENGVIPPEWLPHATLTD